MSIGSSRLGVVQNSKRISQVSNSSQREATSTSGKQDQPIHDRTLLNNMSTFPFGSQQSYSGYQSSSSPFPSLDEERGLNARVVINISLIFTFPGRCSS